MRRHLSFCRALLLAAMFVVLASCGTSGNDAGDTEAAADAAEETTEEASEDMGAVSNVISDDDSGSVASTTAPAFEEEPAEEPAADVPSAEPVDEAKADNSGEAGGELGAAPLTATQQTAADLGRKIIFTADIVVEVDDVAAAGRRATDVIAGLGGFVFGQQTEGGAQPRSTLTFKVLPEDFEAAVQALGSVGELVSQTVSANDVTERVVDLETRIEVAELGVDRLRQALTDSQDLEDYAELERLLLERESELEVMRGSLRTLQDRIDLATITVTLMQDAVNHSMALQVTRYETHDGGASCPGDFGPEGSVETGTETTLCLEIVNTGDEPLTDLTIIDTALGITTADDVITVFGELDRLEAGQSVMVAHEFVADRTVRLRPKVTARPITLGDSGAVEPAGPPIDVRADGFIDVFEPEGDPGFGDGFSAGLAVLAGVWTFLQVTVGFALPLLIPLFIVGAMLWTLRDRFGLFRRSKRHNKPDVVAAPPPPPTASDAPEEKVVETADE